MYEELLTQKYNLSRPNEKPEQGDAVISFSVSATDPEDLHITITKGQEGLHLSRMEIAQVFYWYLQESDHITRRKPAPLSVQIEIERYYEKFDVLPMDQNKETLFAWMNTKGTISWEEFLEQWQSMTLCADCGHVVGYIPDC